MNLYGQGSFLLWILSFVIAIAPPGTGHAQSEASTATGIVYHDVNGNRVRDAGEPGLPSVSVSNGREIVRTDRDGRYGLPVGDDTTLFVIKPEGWATPLSDEMLPQFYYTHKPAGSPRSRFPGVAPTGPLPDSVDFALYRNDEPPTFRAILFGDTQPRDQKEIDYIAHDVIEELIGAEASFGITLGDVMFNNLSLFGSLNRAIALIGIPWYNVIGNHDLNFDSPDDRHSDETFERVYGPPYYSFDYGEVHFLVLDDVVWIGETPEEKGHYEGGLGADQLEFIRNDLSLVPEDQLLVLFMHVPLTSGWQGGERGELFRMIEPRPLTFSVSAHTHWQAHRFITRADGWRGPEPHHHLINVTVCGSWWSGLPDGRGIPEAQMAGGAPNGYSIVTFDGGKYSIQYKAASRPADYQMNIYAPEEVGSGESGQAEVLVNVFAGSERSVVEMRIGEQGAWTPMEMTRRPDPYFVRMKEIESQREPPPGYRELPGIRDSYHLWRANLPAGLPSGTHLIHVRTTDMFGQAYSDKRILRVK